MTQDEVIQRLKDGNKRFVEDKRDGKLQDSNRRQELTDGQKPFAVVLSCADSRVVPELAFDTGLGELFVVRVAGNVTNVSSIASIEYAVNNLGTSVIVVLGHESCGAVTAAMKVMDSPDKGASLGGNLQQLVSYIQPAVTEAGPNSDVNDVVKTNVNHSADGLITNSPILRNALEIGNLRILPAYYKLDSGEVQWL